MAETERNRALGEKDNGVKGGQGLDLKGSSLDLIQSMLGSHWRVLNRGEMPSELGFKKNHLDCCVT